MTKLLPLWVGARGVEFDWKYMQMSFDANISLVSTFLVQSFQLCSIVMSGKIQARHRIIVLTLKLPSLLAIVHCLTIIFLLF